MNLIKTTQANFNGIDFNILTLMNLRMNTIKKPVSHGQVFLCVTS